MNDESDLDERVARYEPLAMLFKYGTPGALLIAINTLQDFAIKSVIDGKTINALEQENKMLRKKIDELTAPLHFPSPGPNVRIDINISGPISAYRSVRHISGHVLRNFDMGPMIKALEHEMSVASRDVLDLFVSRELQTQRRW